MNDRSTRHVIKVRFGGESAPWNSAPDAPGALAYDIRPTRLRVHRFTERKARLAQAIANVVAFSYSAR